MIKIYFLIFIFVSKKWSMEFNLSFLSSIWMTLFFSDQNATFMLMMIMNFFLMNTFMMIFEEMKFLFFLIYFSTSMIFYSNNLFEMFIFFEFSLMPLFVLINSYGDSFKRFSASWMMFFYTFLASIPFFIYLVLIKKESFYTTIVMANYSSKWMPMMIILVLLIKTPIFLFHYWLPKAHVESPYWGSMLLAGLILKIGGFLFIKMVKLMVMSKTIEALFWTSMLGAVISAWNCFLEMDQSVMIAYSSISHMNFMMMSYPLFSNTSNYAMLTAMFSHAMISSMMFFGMGLMYMEMKSKNFLTMKSMNKISSLFIMAYFLILISNFSTPPFMSFFSEILTIYLTFKKLKWLFLMMTTAMMIMSIYNMNMFINLMTGGTKKKIFFKVSVKEITIMVMFLFLTLIGTTVMEMIN